MKRTIKNIVLAAGIVLCASSCSGYFDVLPLNEVVLENYWTEKADVESVLNTCYASLETSDCISRMSCWGEWRSDNIIAGASVGETEKMILTENLLPSNSYTSWESFYKVINYCNTVIYYAPMVQKKDPNYTESQLKANLAEAAALRDLCYFYLIRTFRDVPYVTTPSIDDNRNFMLPATPFATVLDNLIRDLESVKDNSLRKYPEERDNTTKITRNVIYAMLADMYLWKGDYANTVYYADLVIDAKKKEYQDILNEEGSSSDLQLYKSYPLISESPRNASTSGNAYTTIFGDQNSFESLFELSFVPNQSVSNSFLSSAYGNSSNVGYLNAPDFLYVGAYSNVNEVFKFTDARYMENMAEASSKYSIKKYVSMSASFTNTPVSGTKVTPTYSSRSNSFINWIMYRLTDVMLMKAEAQVQLAGDSIKDPRLINAFGLVSAVYNRANNFKDNNKDTLSLNVYGSKSSMESLVFVERQRELMFEGKRWFDLVRMARRDGNNSRLVNLVLRKYTDNVNAIRIRLTSPDIIYFPYNEGELKVNDNLVQNPAYRTEKTTNQTK
jgi:hypothetical protein